MVHANTHGFYRSKFRADCVGSDADEMSPEAIEQLDFIDNTTFNYLEVLASSAGIELQWDMELIGEINDFVISFLKSKGIPIWHPYVSDEDGDDDGI